MRRELAIEFSRATEAAALAGYKWLGRGDKNAADGAAVLAMRHVLNEINIRGEIVIGEGEIDEAPMLYIGERVGTGFGDDVDIDDPEDGSFNLDEASDKDTKNGIAFDRQIFTDVDAKRANDATPLFTKSTITFVVDNTNETIKRDLLVGIKAYIHQVKSAEMVQDLYNTIINKRKFLKFVKFISGEEKSLADLLFSFKEMKSDAINSKGFGQWRNAFKRRKRMSKISLPYLMKEYTPNGTIVITMNEVNYIKNEYGIDIMDPSHVAMIMDNEFLLGFVVVDQTNELVYVAYDGHEYGFQTYTYAALEREQQNSDRMLRELYRSISR